MASLSRAVTGFELKPGLVGSWSSLRKLEEHLRKGARLATEEDLVKGMTTTGNLVLIVRDLEVVPETVVEETAVEKPIKKPIYKMKDKSKVHWVHADMVTAKQAKGYYLVAWDELIEGEDTPDAVVHNGHFLMAKIKGEK